MTSFKKSGADVRVIYHINAPKQCYLQKQQRRKTNVDSCSFLSCQQPQPESPQANKNSYTIVSQPNPVRPCSAHNNPHTRCCFRRHGNVRRGALCVVSKHPLPKPRPPENPIICPLKRSTNFEVVIVPGETINKTLCSPDDVVVRTNV